MGRAHFSSLPHDIHFNSNVLDSEEALQKHWSQNKKCTLSDNLFAVAALRYTVDDVVVAKVLFESWIMILILAMIISALSCNTSRR